jgi:hypothetical protein
VSFENSIGVGGIFGFTLTSARSAEFMNAKEHFRFDTSPVARSRSPLETRPGMSVTLFMIDGRR